MAVIIYTNDPHGLVKSIKAGISNHAIETWSYDSDGDFTHTPPQWRGEAWLRPLIGNGTLTFGLLGKKGVVMTTVLYGVYHGRFIEMLLTHFDDKFVNAVATAQKQAADDFKTG
jgi:hypothetical protein